MNKEIKPYILVIVAVTAMVAGITIGALTERTDKVYEITGRGVSDNKLNAIWNLVDRNYVDILDGDSVMDNIYRAVLSTLDPHSVYLTRGQMEKESELLRGNFEGIGVVIRMIDDTVRVSQVIPDGPSDKAGLLAGDCILNVDGIDVSGVKMVSDSVVSHLRGSRRSVAKLTVLRLSEQRKLNINVTRDVITTPSMAYFGMIDSQTGYIRLERFGETTHNEFASAIDKLKGQGMKRLLLDLRGNSGGLLSAAIDICDDLLPGREMIVYTEGAHERRRETHSSRGGRFGEGELIVLIDEYSASASEIVAGAIQDNDRGLVVGRKSFGKGLVQQQFRLPDKSAVQLTIARYYTPSGRCIQRPYDKGTDEYYNDFIQNIMNEYEGDTILTQINDSTPYYTTGGRTVYGGGGIYPDHTIHYAKETDIGYYNQILRKLIISDYVFDYVTLHGSQIKTRYNETRFVKEYRVTDETLEALFRYGERKGVARDNACISKYREEIRSRIKAEIGQMLYSNHTFYSVLLKYDNDITQAMKYFK